MVNEVLIKLLKMVLLCCGAIDRSLQISSNSFFVSYKILHLTHCLSLVAHNGVIGASGHDARK